jgi:hypothetical protein
VAAIGSEMCGVWLSYAKYYWHQKPSLQIKAMA